MDDINPDDLIFDYLPFETPIYAADMIGGERVSVVYRGRMRASWDSPRGRFHIAWAVRENRLDDYEHDQQLRREIALRLGEAYELSTQEGFDA